MKKLIALPAILIMLVNHVFAQKDTITTIEKKMVYGLGYSHNRTLDLQNSPLIYTANLLELNIGYEKYKFQKSIFDLSLNIHGGISQPKGIEKREIGNYYYDKNDNEVYEIVPLVHPELRINAIAGYLHRINKLSGKQFDTYIGGQIHEFAYLNYLATFGFEQPSIINALTLDPKALIDFNIKNFERGFISISFPVVGLVTRLPYSNVPSIYEHSPMVAIFADGTQLTSLNTYQKIEFDTGIEKELNEKWNMRLSYRFEWFHCSEAVSINSYLNNINISFIRKKGN